MKLRSSDTGNEKDGGRCRDSDYRIRTNGYRHFMETYRKVARVVHDMVRSFKPYGPL